MEAPDQENSSFGLIAFLYRHFKALIIVSLSAAVVAAAVSFFIENKYRSTVILYPSNTSSISKVLINTGGAKGDILEFGEEEKVEQLLQVLHSDKVRDAVIKQFDLMKHYEIDTASPSKFTDLNQTFESNIKFKRNEYMAAEISVLDKDPVKASAIANGIAKILDDVMNNIQKERSMPGFKIVEKSYLDFLAYQQSLEDSLNFIMGKGVHDVEAQSEVLTSAYADAIGKGNKAAVESINEKLALLNKYGAQQYNLKEKLQNTAIQLSLLKEKYDEAKIDANERIPNFFMVNEAKPAEKKSYPVRWLIVSVSTICTFVFAVLALLVNEKIKLIKSSSKL
ncbi:MAG: Wzz/FepE/Etk N-terminal domain-containing protein [Flavobacteriales bacterium]